MEFSRYADRRTSSLSGRLVARLLWAAPRSPRSRSLSAGCSTTGNLRRQSGRLRLSAAPSDPDLRRAGGLRHAGRDERPGAVAARSKRRFATTWANTAPTAPARSRSRCRPARPTRSPPPRPGTRSTTRWCAPACRAGTSRSRLMRLVTIREVAPLRLSYLRVKAVAPTCGIWPETTARRDYRNAQLPQFRLRRAAEPRRHGRQSCRSRAAAADGAGRRRSPRRRHQQVPPGRRSADRTSC